MKILVSIILLSLLGLAVWLSFTYFSTQREHSFPVEKMPKSFDVYIVGEEKEELLQKIDSNQELYADLKKLVTENQSGWKVNYANYKPIQKFVSSSLIIDLIDGGIVAKYLVNDGDWLQISKSFSQEKLDTLGVKH